MERVRPRLLVLRDERGRELFDLPEAPRTEPGTPAPPRFRPEFDTLLLSHADRARVVADEHRRWLMSTNGVGRGTFLVDGFVAGTWKIESTKATATLHVDPLAPLAAPDREALAEEGGRLLTFAAPDAPTHDSRIHRTEGPSDSSIPSNRTASAKLKTMVQPNGLSSPCIPGLSKSLRFRLANTCGP